MAARSVDSDDPFLMTDPLQIKGSRILFVTGRLAEASLRSVVSGLAERLEFQFEIVVPGIQVAALLHADLLQRRLEITDAIDRVILPGWCQGSIAGLESRFGVPFERGPKNLHDLPEYFGLGKQKNVSLDQFDLEIIAEINHATQQSVKDVVEEAELLTNDGADVIDVGCVPGASSDHVGEIVTALRGQGLRVSIDSFEQSEVEQAVACGAELILSCNQTNIDWVSKLGTELVVIPDTPSDMDSLDRSVEQLSCSAVPFRVDPIIEPIGMGFAASLQRYADVRAKYPGVPMMMGTGNITELTEVDSAGINMILAAICGELQIQSVLTTQVINWCRSSVAELNMARRLVHHSIAEGVVPKHLDSSLVMMRDARVRRESEESLNAMAAALTDANYRIFAGREGVHLMNRDGHWSGSDSFEVFSRALQEAKSELKAGHAFYLGYEMARAELAQHLSKNYVQDEPLQWGLLGEWKASSAVHESRPSDESEKD